MTVPNEYATVLLRTYFHSPNKTNARTSDVQNVYKGRVVAVDAGRGESRTKGNMDLNDMETTEPSKSDMVDQVVGKERPKLSCFMTFCKVLFVLLGFIIIGLTLAVIVLTVGSAIVIQSYSINGSHRIAAMIVLTITSAISFSVIIYGIVGVLRNQKRAARIATIVIFSMTVVQVVVCWTSLKFTANDEQNLARSLKDSFKAATQLHNHHNLRLWSHTQHDLECCGVNGPDDYMLLQKRTMTRLPPDIHVSCCKDYRPNFSELVQDKIRETCRFNRTFWQRGCLDMVVELFQASASFVIVVMVALIIAQVLASIFGLCLSRKTSEKLEINDS